MKIQRFLARAGVASRRKAADLIKKGLVKVNGEVVDKPYFQVDPERDCVEFKGEQINLPLEWTYILLNKPEGVITTASDEFGRKTVMNLIDLDEPGLVPVGRLDEDSEGLILITNDGKLAHQLTHPSFEIEKEYKVVLPRAPGYEIKTIEQGIKVGDDYLKASRLRFGKDKIIFITLKEGKNREIRRMLGRLGYRVEHLIRIRIGNLELGDLSQGEWRKLTQKEVKNLKELCYGF